MKNIILIAGTVIAVAGTIITSVQKIELKENANVIAEINNNTEEIIQTTEVATRENTVTSRSSDETRTSKEIVEENVKESEKFAEELAQIEEETKTVQISDVRISKNMDLTVRTGLSRADFIKLMAGVRYDTSGFFEDNAGTIYDLCEKYNINEIFFCGLISAESGWNIASNHRSTHNYISLMYKGKLLQYNSVYEGLEVAAQKLNKNYLTPGGAFYHGKTLSGVHVCFCPSDTWVDLVYGRMKQIL